MSNKPVYTPAQIATMVTENMKRSAPETDLNALTDMKALENMIIGTLREMQMSVPHMIFTPVTKH